MIKSLHKTPMKWSFLVIGMVVALAFVTLSNAKANTSSADGTMASVMNNTFDSNFQTVKIEPNKLISNEGWSLSITKVASLGGAHGEFGYHSPFNESDTARNYAIFFTIENADGKDKAFLPKGKVLGIVGTSGKFYGFHNGIPSLDKWYSDEHWESIGEPNSPGVFKFDTGADVDLNEQGVAKVIYQDENGTKYEIPSQGNISVIWKQVDIISQKVANLYGESNSKIVKVKPFPGKSANLSGYIISLEGNFSKDGKKASTIEFSMLADGTRVWALRGYNEGEGKDIWLDNEVSI